VNEEGAAEVGFAFDWDCGFGFDVLGEKFGEDDLFGEKLGADGDFGLGRLVAGGREERDVEKIKEVKESGLSATHIRRLCSLGNKEFNTEDTENTEIAEIAEKKKQEGRAKARSHMSREEESVVRRLSICVRGGRGGSQLGGRGGRREWHRQE